MSTETRQRLIDLIIQGYYSNDRNDFKVGRIAERAGITRQAFHRYHGDLLRYIKGEKDVSGLLPKTEQSLVTKLLVEAQDRVLQLEAEVSTMDDRHRQELATTLDRHITSLMKNDIALYENDEITVSLEKQSALIENYSDQINELKTQLTKATLAKTNNNLLGTAGARVTLDTKLQSALLAYKKNGNYDTYLDAKDKEISKLIEKINTFSGSKIRLLVFLERYISDFADFVKSLPPPLEDEVVIRLPIYTNFELKSFVKKITLPGPKIFYIPECLSTSEAQAQRKFRALIAPEPELAQASKPEYVYLFKGIDQVIHQVVSPGR